MNEKISLTLAKKEIEIIEWKIMLMCARCDDERARRGRKWDELRNLILRSWAVICGWDFLEIFTWFLYAFFAVI